MLRYFYVLLCLWVLLPSTSLSQSYIFTESSNCTVNGGSTLRDWTATSSSVQGEVVFEKAFLKKSVRKAGTGVEAASFRVPVKSLKGRADAMNTKIYNAFKSEEHPSIQFELKSGTVRKGSAQQDGSFTLDCTGLLKMAGAAQTVSLSLDGKPADQGFHFTGTIPIDMTEYGIKPPSAMFGQIIVEPKINVDFDLYLEKQ